MNYIPNFTSLFLVSLCSCYFITRIGIRFEAYLIRISRLGSSCCWGKFSTDLRLLCPCFGKLDLLLIFKRFPPKRCVLCALLSDIQRFSIPLAFLRISLGLLLLLPIAFSYSKIAVSLISTPYSSLVFTVFIYLLFSGTTITLFIAIMLSPHIY